MPLVIYGLEGVDTCIHSHMKVIPRNQTLPGLTKFECVYITMCSSVISPFSSDYLQTQID